ncbi:alpha mannosidase-like protein [Mycena rebaudengoi]|nr:alpha mannosidase-like protein [Mycena rebaudengoi]
MYWPKYWPESLLAVLVIALEGSRWANDTNASSPLTRPASGWTNQRKLTVREKTRELWYHGFDNYMSLAFPLDELTPISCSGQGPDWDHPDHYAANDVLGNFSLTLIDVLDTLVVLDDRPGFERAVKNVIEWVSFDVNTRPQVFETTIRVLGGLLSGHIFANQTGQPFFLPWYHGELLEMAHDLGKRLLPAFSTPTGLPYARINLRHGVLRGESVETCTAGAGSLILEFATLSRLTGDDRFEKAAYKAFFAIWNRRTDIGLVGNTINTRTGVWTKPEVSGIGAGMDSFYEYALKWYIMSGDVEFLDVWDDAYAAIMRYARAPDGFWYRPVHMSSGDTAYFTVDSLSAFWPGLQGIYYNLWRKHSGLPEVYDSNFKQATSHQYPLRPEFVESTWYLYRATRDPFYLDVGERILSDITARSKVACGLAGVKDLRSNALDDRMESFALSETLKYLFLLFDEDNPLHKDDSNYVFTTEGHLLTLGSKHLKPTSVRRKMRKVETHQCPAYRPFRRNGTGLTLGVRSRGDVDYARELVSMTASDSDKIAWSPWGWCERPHVNLFAYDFILSANSKVVAEDLSPSRLKLDVVDDGYIIHNVTGVRIRIVQRIDSKGYDVRRSANELQWATTTFGLDTWYISTTRQYFRPAAEPEVILDERPLDVPLRIFVDSPELFLSQTGVPDLTNLDGCPRNRIHCDVWSRRGRPSALRPPTSADGPANTYGCDAYPQSLKDAVILKLVTARAAGAAGVLVVLDDSIGLNPTADPEELAEAGDIGDVGMVVLTAEVGKLVHDMLDNVEEMGGQVMLQMDPERTASDSPQISQQDQEKRQEEKSHKVLYLNGHPLLNTRLLF